MSVKTSCLVSILSVILAGCANLYQPPKANEPTAYVKATNSRTELTTWTNPQVTAIDNQSAGMGWSSNARLHPGNHTLTIKTEFNNGFFSGGPFEAFSDIHAHFNAGETYTIQAAVQGSQLLVSLNDQSGRKISSTVSSYHTA